MVVPDSRTTFNVEPCPQKLVKVIRSLYENFECRVIHSNQLTELFKVKTGVKQGCILSPLLFSMAIDWIMSRTTEGRRQGIQWTLTSLSMHTKLRIFKSNVLSVLLYGPECWKTTATIERKLEVFQNKFLRRIMKVFWPNMITNMELRRRAGASLRPPL